MTSTLHGTKYGNLSQAIQTILTSSSISPHWFPIGVACNAAHIKFVFGTQSYGWKEDDYKALIDRMVKERTSAMSWAKAKLEQRLVENMKTLGVSATNFSSLRALFKEDCSSYFAAKLWQACYGMFDQTPMRETDLEKEYMQVTGISYSASDDGKQVKGCIAKIMTHTKNELIKSLNKAGKYAHGGTIRLKRRSSEVAEGTKFKRRKKGTALGLFFSNEKDDKPLQFYLDKVSLKNSTLWPILL